MNEGVISLVILLLVFGGIVYLLRSLWKSRDQMSKDKKVLKHPVTGETKVVYKGFSWPAFLLTPFWCAYKGLYLQALISFISFFTIIGGIIYWTIAGLKGNEWYYDSLIDKGYKPKNQLTEEKTGTDLEEMSNLSKLEKLQELREKGALTEEEFKEKKKELL